MLEIKNLTKIYKLSNKQMQQAKTKKNTKIAVENISLSAKKGEIFGLLGPNGAGKTTTLRCIATLLKPTEGFITVCGFDTVKQSEQVRKNIGFLTNEIKLDPQFTPRYLFDFFGKLHGVKPETLEIRRKELFEYFGITQFEDKKIDELSTGMKQKAAIAVSLVHNPEIIIFDEPTNGLDIITARSVTEYLKVLRNQGKLVVVSTHIMSEAEKLCDTIAIILDGKKVIEGTLQDILDATDTKDLEDAFFELYNRQKEAN
jgi:sodium transport system ATP-binding protein